MHDHKMYCIMNSGKPLNKMIADVLLYNAYDMFQQGRRTQRIKSRQYDGVIESNLRVVEYSGIPSVQFEAIVSTEMWESNTVRFVIRTDDLEGLEQAEWGQLSLRVFGPMSFKDLPQHIQDQIRNSNDELEFPPNNE